MDRDEEVILVDEQDKAIGAGPKLEVHADGRLHRAFSVFVFNRAGQLLMHQRAETKYHSGGLWTNTCCGHPRPGESVADAASRRLGEEMGFDCELIEIGVFTYRAELDHDLIEHEIDHVFTGRYDVDPSPAPEEVQAWEWVEVADLRERLIAEPERFTAWFPFALRALPS